MSKNSAKGLVGMGDRHRGTLSTEPVPGVQSNTHGTIPEADSCQPVAAKKLLRRPFVSSPPPRITSRSKHVQDISRSTTTPRSSTHTHQRGEMNNAQVYPHTIPFGRFVLFTPSLLPNHQPRWRHDRTTSTTCGKTKPNQPPTQKEKTRRVGFLRDDPTIFFS